QPIVRAPEDLQNISKQYDAIYKGLLNLVHFVSGGLVNWQNGDRLSPKNNLEDHHIFPKDYLRRTLGTQDTDVLRQIDCVANRTLIPKLQNIKFSNRAPSIYMQEIAHMNKRLNEALMAHMIPVEIVTGAYDDVYAIFMEDRAKGLFELINGVTVL